jgi:hypothetical protein
MEPLSTSAFVLISLSVLFCSGCGFGLHLWYRRRLRRYERFLEDTYAAHLEQRAVTAMAWHASVARALDRSKFVLQQVRTDLPNAPTRQAALEEVSNLLEGAAVESDRALRSLESAPPDGLTAFDVATRAHVGKTDPHHDR